MISYHAKITKQRNSTYFVEFLELPGCYTEGKNIQQALKYAKEALEVWLASHCDRNLDVPAPKMQKGKNFYPVEVDVQIEFAIQLRRLRMKKGLTQREVANRLGISQQAYAKLEIPETANPSLTTLQKLSHALEVNLNIKLVA